MTERGPRSRTLATFRKLTPEIVERARERAQKDVSEEEIARAALRAGAPVAERPADRAARELLGELARGRRPKPVLRRLLQDALGDRDAGASDSARAAASWSGATDAERGAALRDLLLLADKLPQRRREPRTRFPRLETRS